MRSRLLAYWDLLRTSFWFLPSLMALAALGLAWGTLQIDQRAGTALERLSIFAATPMGARSMLSGVAAAMITLAGLTFSMTIVAITVASQQFGARLLRNFMGDLSNQFVLGVFVAIFLYSLLILGSIRNEAAHAFVPNLSVTLSVVFAVFGLGVLIYYIHHVSASIDVARLIEVVGRDIDRGIESLFPEQIGEELPGVAAEPPSTPGAVVAATANGYVQLIDDQGLLAAAGEHDSVMRLDCRPGDLIVAGMPVAIVWPESNDALSRAINGAIIVGIQRTPLQDLEFAIDQLVEIGVRALSPGINDPFTAMLCVDRLTISLARLAGRSMPRAQRFDADNILRVVARRWTYGGALNAAFDQLRP